MATPEEIRAERVEAAFRQTPLAVGVNLLNAALMAVALAFSTNEQMALPWLAGAVAVAVLRLAIWRARRGRSNAVPNAHWGTVSACSAAAAGVFWGSGAAWLWPQSEPLQLFWIFVVGGMCTGAAALHHAHLPTALAFILPAGLPIALSLAGQGTERGLASAAMAAVYLAALTVSAVRASAYFGDNLGLRLDLTRRTRELDAVNAELLAEVAEHRATAASLRHAQKMEAVGQLAGGVAHDFNNILQAVSGGAALIRRHSRDPRVEHLASLVANAARRGEAVARRLLAFSRRGELRAEAVDPSELLAGLREVLAATLGPSIQVIVDAPRDVPLVLADRGQLETVLLNLSTNARDAMPGGGTLTLAIETEPPDDTERLATGPALAAAHVRIVVLDTGTGMDAETLAHATEPFFTTKAQGRGTGLGLAMARDFAEGSGGALAIESAPGHGTRVALSLPVALPGPRQDAPPYTPSGRRAPPGTSPAVAPDVLLVDDEPIVREILARQLREEGYTVSEAPGGDAALAMLDRGAHVDLLVSDLAMPELDGIAVIREARQRRRGLPAILLTGFAGDTSMSVASGALGAGAFALIRKPVSGAELAEQMAALLSPPANDPPRDAPAPRIGKAADQPRSS
ncbi:response regulator [Falsiroseomonas sp. HW251]|uniref:response regulator n=1 Tax=Falsiroseomonas sp. HW251 TaxID=3390998 RepID=UPI003D313864